MSEAAHIGRVLGSEHTTTQEFRVVLEEDEYAQLDDLVMTRTLVPKAGEVRTYGVVSEVQAVYEGASYESDTHRIAAEGILPGAKVRSATVTVTRVDPELWVAPDPGGVVERARGEERQGEKESRGGDRQDGEETLSHVRSPFERRATRRGREQGESRYCCSLIL